VPSANYIVLVLFIAAFIMSVILHEVAHGWMAARCGDHTAEAAGRLSLNPIPHIDLFMTIFLPIMLYVASGGTMIFGGAKPVPINPYNFRNLELDDLKVSLAGVAVNFAIALVFGFSLHLFAPDSVGFTLFTLITIYNLILSLFNLIPIPPLDGSHVLRFVIARANHEVAAAYERIGRFGFIFVILLLRFLWRPILASINFVWFRILAIHDVHWLEVILRFRQSF